MRHLDLDLLQAVLDGDLPPKSLLRRLLDHLGELCPECSEAVASLRQGKEDQERELVRTAAPDRGVTGAGVRSSRATTLPDPRFVGAFDRAQQAAAEWTKRVRREKRRARADLGELMRLPRGVRAERVERARTRFRSRTLAELLLEKSRLMIRDDPAEAQDLAALVEVVLLWTPGAVDQDWARELAISARAWEANALRVGGELRTADRRFDELRSRVGRETIVSEAVHAELCSLEASLRIDQRRLSEARNLLDRAALLFRHSGAHEDLAKVLVKTAIVESETGDLAASVDVQRQLLRLLEETGQDDLFLASVVNLSVDLNELGQTDAAAELLARHHESLSAAELWEVPRTQVLRGRIALAKGHPVEAERLFLAARTELIRRGDAVRAAVASLDLALLYLDQGKTGELRRMARSMGQVFESEDLHEEAMATVVLFQRAVAAESVTVEALRAWRRQLETGGHLPRARQVQPS